MRGDVEEKDLSRTIVLSGGTRVPYPNPSSAAASSVGRANRRRDTRPEVALRSAFHRRGLRFRKDLLVRADGVRARVDVVLVRSHVAVFVDGCFWHGCPAHGSAPRTNTEYWIPKLEANRKRDQRVTDALTAAGWLVVRVWEHEDPEVVAERLVPVVRGRAADRRAPRTVD